MSTLKVVNVQHPSAATAAITLDAAGGALIGGQAAYSRNLLYNGAMQVHQRGTSVAASNLETGYYTADRWQSLKAITLGLGQWTQTIETDAPTGSGFRKSLKVLCTTSDSSPDAPFAFAIRHNLEGQDLQRIAKGTSSAQQLTLSFWVKSNVTGTYVAELNDVDNTRHAATAYTVLSSGTWERKTITFAADTTGAFDNDNAASLQLLFFLGAGSDFTSGTLPTGWAARTTANRAVGQTNLAAATNNYWQVTGVQLEVGPAATPFEFKSFGQELRECQRYYTRFDATGASSGQVFGPPAIFITQAIAEATFIFSTRMRVSPTAIETLRAAVYQHTNTTTYTTGTWTQQSSNVYQCNARYTHGTNVFTAGQVGAVVKNGGTGDDCHISFTAEL